MSATAKVIIPGRSIGLRKLHAGGFTLAQIKEMGGDVQGRNVVFAHGCAGFEKVGEILALRKRPVKFIDTLDDDEREIYQALGSKPTEELGDKLEKLFAKIGADRAAKLFEQITGRPCGCEGRKKKLNAWSARLRKFFARTD